MLFARLPFMLTAALAVFGLFSPMRANALAVEVTTPEGVMVLNMRTDDAPLTVANFLRYIDDGDYQDSFFHRSVPGFVIQAGGFTIDTNSFFDFVPADDPVINEPGISNTRGTVAMAKLGNDPNSATSEWFINLADNSQNLDNQNGGFTVFADVVSGMEVADAIAALTIVDIGSPLDELPILDGAQPPTVDQDEVVLTSYRVIPDMDGDLDVDGVDLSIMFANFTGPGATDFGNPSDLDGDGDVDGVDLSRAFIAFTGPGTPAVSVPEPGSAMLVLLGGAALVSRRRRR